MLRRSSFILQFKMGKYKGPLPLNASVTMKQQSAIQAASEIVHKIKQQDFNEQQERDKVLDTRKFIKHLRDDPSSFLSDLNISGGNNNSNNRKSFSNVADKEKREKAQRYLQEFQKHYLLQNNKNNNNNHPNNYVEQDDDEGDIFEKKQPQQISSSLDAGAEEKDGFSKVDADGNVIDEATEFEGDESERSKKLVGTENNEGAFLPNHNNNNNTTNDDENGDLGASSSFEGRAHFEIPTLATSVPAEAWIAKAKLLDSKRHPTTLTRRGRKRLIVDTEQEQEKHKEDENRVTQETTNNNNNNATSDGHLNFKEIDRFLLSPALAHIFANRRRDWGLTSPSSVQAMALECCLAEKRDVCCLAPTGTGKTLCYVLPAIQTALEANDLADESSTYSLTQARLQERDLQRGKEMQQKIEDAQRECKYCGLDIRQQKVCPSTGAPHPPISSLANGRTTNSFVNRERLSRTGTPTSLIICPTGVLVDQAYTILRSMHCGLRIGFLRGTVDQQVRQEMARSLESCDILVSTSGYCLWALNKGLINVSNVKFFAIDEIDMAIQLPEFDLLSLLMSRLPGGGASRRDSKHIDVASGETMNRHTTSRSDAVTPPRKMFVGASLPVKMFPLISKMMNQETARWVIGDALPFEGGDRGGSVVSPQNNRNDQQRQDQDTFGGTTIASNITHSVLMIASPEKADKLRWLYDTGKLSGAQQVLIFCNTKNNVRYLMETIPHLLAHHYVKVSCVLPKQGEETRIAALRRFQNRNVQILITTDMLARGVDFQNVNAVLQWDFPHHFENFVHRAGRTGRRGESGVNIAFFEQQDARLAKQLAKFLHRRRQDVPPKLATYANQSWSDLYREQVHGMQMRTFNPKNPDVRKSPLGLSERRWPNVEDLSRRNNKAKHLLMNDLKEEH